MGAARAAGAAPRSLGLKARPTTGYAFSTIFQNESFFTTLSPRKV